MKTAATANHVDRLDFLRGVAIIAVLLFHVLGMAYAGRDQLPWVQQGFGSGWLRSLDVTPGFLALVPLTFGWAGVAVFFVVSGFCIHLSHARSSQPGWQVFAVRRFFRIYPPYLFALAFCAAWWLYELPVFHGITIQNPAAHLLSHFVLLNNASEPTLFSIAPVFWSIAVEAQLYAVYPLLLGLVGRLGWPRTLVILGAVEFTIRVCSGISQTMGHEAVPTMIGWSPFAFWFSWSIGAALADAWMTKSALPFRKVHYAVYALGFVLCSAVKPLLPFAFPFAALATVAWLASHLANDVKSTTGESSRLRWLNRVVVQIGVWSFSLYLLHQTLLMQIPHLCRWLAPERTFPRLGLFGLGLLALIPITALAALYFRAVELPSIGMGKRWLARLKATAASEAAAAEAARAEALGRR